MRIEKDLRKHVRKPDPAVRQQHTKMLHGTCLSSAKSNESFARIIAIDQVFECILSASALPSHICILSSGMPLAAATGYIDR